MILTKPMELDPTRWRIARRGDNLLLMDRDDEALKDCDAPLNMSEIPWAIMLRGKTLLLAGAL
jgi:hypothetical protein